MKRIIIRNQKEESSDEIAKKKDFAAVLLGAEAMGNTPPTSGAKGIAKKWFLNTWTWVAVVGTSTLIGGVLLTNDFFNKDQSTQQQQTPPPTTISQSTEETEQIFNEALNVPFNTYVISADNGGSFTHFTGTQVTVPANAFIDENGNSVTGDIIIQYREFHDPIDIFVSRIPMEYDTLKKTFTFESAGMCDIRGYQNGKQVRLVPEKSIQIDMESRYGGNHYNLYYLNDDSQTWECKGKPALTDNRVSGKNPFDQEIQELEEQLTNIERAIDRKNNELVYSQARMDQTNAFFDSGTPVSVESGGRSWRQYNPEMPSFRIKVNETEFPELALFKDVRFQIFARKIQLPKNLYRTHWEELTLKKVNDNSYDMHLSKGVRKYVIPVEPVLTKEDMDKLQANYEECAKEKDSIMRIAEEKMATAKGNVSKLQGEIAALRKEFEETEGALNLARASGMSYQNEQAKLTSKIIRSFNVTQFGTWNCDSPIPQPDGQKFYAKFKEKNGATINLYQYALIERKRNALFNFNGAQKLQFNPEEDNFLMAFDKKGNLVYYDTEDFKSIPSGIQKTYTIKLNRPQKTIETYEDIKKAFEL